jgi:putative transposase
MPRLRRIAPDGLVHHVLNRGNAKATIFHSRLDYEHFLLLLAEANDRVPMRLLAFCLMRNHWHLVLWPFRGGDLSAYMQWLTNAHVRQHHKRHGTVGHGHLYQGRFKNFVIQTDLHLFAVLRYVEANAYRAGLVGRAEDWPWSSAHRATAPDRRLLTSAWPVPKPADWPGFLNEPATEWQLKQLRRSVHRGAPFGEVGWVEQTAETLGLQSTLQPQGRPKRDPSREKGTVPIYDCSL